MSGQRVRGRVARAIMIGRHDAFSLLGRWEAASIPFLNLQRHLSPWPVHVTRRETDLVIDGYPRSANTYALQLFVYANGHDHRLAHHVHAPVQFKRAARFGVPALLLVRHPRDAVCSRVVHEPIFGVRRAVRDFVWMYEPLLDRLDDLVVAPFETVTRDFDPVIEEVNARWGTRFQGVGDRIAADAWIRDKIAWWHEYRAGGDVSQLPIPTADRDEAKGAARRALDRLKGDDLWRRAMEAYDAIIDR